MSNLMDETVKEICGSMCKDPNRWQITTCTVNDKVSGVKYWLDGGIVGTYIMMVIMQLFVLVSSLWE